MAVGMELFKGMTLDVGRKLSDKLSGKQLAHATQQIEDALLGKIDHMGQRKIGLSIGVDSLKLGKGHGGAVKFKADVESTSVLGDSMSTTLKGQLKANGDVSFKKPATFIWPD